MINFIKENEHKQREKKIRKEKRKRERDYLDKEISASNYKTLRRREKEHKG
jgi:hypothetical protein